MRKYERVKCDPNCTYITYKNKWLYCDCYDEKLRMHIGPDGPEDMVYLISYRCDDCIDDEFGDEDDIEEGYDDEPTVEERMDWIENEFFDLKDTYKNTLLNVLLRLGINNEKK